MVVKFFVLGELNFYPDPLHCVKNLESIITLGTQPWGIDPPCLIEAIANFDFYLLPLRSKIIVIATVIKTHYLNCGGTAHHI